MLPSGYTELEAPRVFFYFMCFFLAQSGAGNQAALFYLSTRLVGWDVEKREGRKTVKEQRPGMRIVGEDVLLLWRKIEVSCRGAEVHEGVRYGKGIRAAKLKK